MAPAGQPRIFATFEAKRLQDRTHGRHCEVRRIKVPTVYNNLTEVEKEVQSKKYKKLEYTDYSSSLKKSAWSQSGWSSLDDGYAGYDDVRTGHLRLDEYQESPKNVLHMLP